MKKYLVLALMLILAVCIIPAPDAQAADISYPVVGGNIYFDEATGTITECSDGVIEADIPAEINGVAVTAIGDRAFYMCDSLVSLTIPNSVTSIGMHAFTSCNGLTSVTIPDSVTSIGPSSFYNCVSLKSVTIPGSITRIGSYAFAICSRLKTVAFSEGTSYIGENMFENCSQLASVYIPASMTKVYNNAFSGCSALSDVYYGGTENSWNNVAIYSGNATLIEAEKHFGIDGFGICGDDLTWVFDGIDTIKFIGKGNMYDYDVSSAPWANAAGSINTVFIDGRMTSIGDNAFCGFENLTDVYYDLTTAQWNALPKGEGNEALSSAEIHCSQYVAQGTCGDNLTWTLNSEGVLTISGTGDMYTFGYQSFGWYPYSEYIESIIACDGVASIAYNAFCDCPNLTSVTIPSSVTSIGNEPFYNSPAITDVFYGGTPEQWIAISDETYHLNLSSVRIHFGDVVYLGLGRCGKNLTYVITEDGTLTITGTGEMYSGAFDNNTQIITVVLPEGLTSIGGYAFRGCTSLTDITIPYGVTAIGYDAFYGCTGVTNVTIPSSVTYIYGDAFYNCTAITDVYYDGTPEQWMNISIEYGNQPLTNARLHFGDVVYLGYGKCGENLTYVITEDGTLTVTGTGEMYDGAFYNKSFNESIINAVLSDGVTSIGLLSFGDCSNLTSITIPSSVTSIGDSAFRRTGLTSVTIPNSVTSISARAFYGCTSLISITIPSSVTSIGYEAFCGCTSLKTAVISNGVPYIGESMFSGCTDLTSVTIPNNVTSIGDSAFYGCAGLTSVTIPNSVTSIGDSAFYGCTGLTSVTIPHSVMSIGQQAFFGCTALTSVTIPNSVTSIGDNAFRNCKSLTSITIPDSVTSIGSYLFEDCTNLSSVTLGSGITTIPNGMFRGLGKLQQVTIPEGVTSIGSNAFYNCSHLANIVIPNGVTTIGQSAFEGCQRMISVTIPASVTEIGKSAFSGCYSLQEVIYRGTEAQWNEIEIRSNNTELLNAMRTYDGSNAVISNMTGGAATVSSVVNRKFTVTSDSACVVAYTTDGGQTYTKLTGTGTGSTRSFRIPISAQGATVAVVLKGDIMLDGEPNTTDVTQMKRFIAGKRNLEPLQILAADVTGEGKVNTTDITQLKRYIAGTRTFSW